MSLISDSYFAFTYNILKIHEGYRRLRLYVFLFNFSSNIKRRKRSTNQVAYQLQANLVFYNKIVSEPETEAFLKNFEIKSNETITKIILPEFAFKVDISQFICKFIIIFVWN